MQSYFESYAFEPDMVNVYFDFGDEQSDAGSTCASMPPADDCFDIGQGKGGGADVYFDIEEAENDIHEWHSRLGSCVESKDELSKSDLEEKIKQAQAMTNFNKLRIGFAVPPSAPFVVTYDPRSSIFAIAYSNILCVDIDIKDGHSKQQAAEAIEHVANSTGLAFRLYETDAGMHGYCTSRTFSFKDQSTLDLMHKMKCDLWYIAFVRMRGFSMRLSPKPFADVDRREPKSKSEFEAQFVQKPWWRVPVVGPASARKEENMALASMVHLTYELAQYVCQLSQLYERVYSDLESDTLLRDISHEAERLFMMKSGDPAVKSHMSVWLQTPGTFDVPFRNDIDQWYPSRRQAGNECTRHPVDGKPITVYQSQAGSSFGRWAYAYDGHHEGPFPSKRAARKAVRQRFGHLWPTNVQTRETPAGAGEPMQPPQSQPLAAEALGCSLSAKQAAEWVKTLFPGTCFADKYSQAFLDLGIDGDMLVNDLTDDVLQRDLGIAVEIHRKKILRRRLALA